jgi:hypothetical protein
LHSTEEKAGSREDFDSTSSGILPRLVSKLKKSNETVMHILTLGKLGEGTDEASGTEGLGWGHEQWRRARLYEQGKDGRAVYRETCRVDYL